MSPVYGGAIAKKPSRPISTTSRPVIFINASVLQLSNENSRFAQLSQMITCSGDHWRGSAKKKNIKLHNCGWNLEFLVLKISARPTWSWFNSPLFHYIVLTLKRTKNIRSKRIRRTKRLNLINMRDRNKFPENVQQKVNLVLNSTDLNLFLRFPRQLIEFIIFNVLRHLNANI